MDSDSLAYRNIAVIGSSGAIGSAFIQHLVEREDTKSIHAFSRENISTDSDLISSYIIDYNDEASIEKASGMAAAQMPLDLVIVATGILHDGSVVPEKSLRELSVEKFEHLYHVNTVVPALIAKHFIPRLNRDTRSVFAALSARVGSISDNRLGGWYSYRASKAALNMIIKCASIEVARRNKNSVIIGLHPGTVDSNLSKPFQKNLPEGQLFTPKYATARMLEVIDRVTVADSGKCFAFDGEEVEP